MTAAETEEAIEIIRHWMTLDVFAALMTPKGNHKLWRAIIKEGLRQGEPLSEAVRAARDRDVYADHALRELGAEMLIAGEELPPELTAYLAEAVLCPPLSFPRGRNDLADKGRDIALATCVQMAMDRWDLKHTRNDATAHPSASTVVAEAYKRSGYAPVAEKRVERIYIKHQKDARSLAAKMSASNTRFDAYDMPRKIV